MKIKTLFRKNAASRGTDGDTNGKVHRIEDIITFLETSQRDYLGYLRRNLGKKRSPRMQDWWVVAKKQMLDHFGSGSYVTPRKQRLRSLRHWTITVALLGLHFYLLFVVI